MAEVSPREAILGSGPGGPLTAPGPWIQYQGYISYAGGIVIGSPTGGNKGAGTINAPAYYINGTIIDLTKYLPFTGGTLTGFLTLNADPTSPFHAATKRYIDNLIITVDGYFASYLPLAGGTLTGPLVLPGNPTSDLQAATKKYVDTTFSGQITINDAPSDGTTYGRKNGAWVDTATIDVGTY